MVRSGRTVSLGIVAMLLVLALGALGVVYGLWSQTLTVQGVVSTGTLHARWTGAICSEFFDWPWPPEGLGEVEGKDVGSTTAVVDPNDDTVLNVVIENGYPSYAVDCEVEFENDGSVPWIVRGIAIEPGPNLTNCTFAGTQTVTMSCDQLTVVYADGIGSQVDPGDGLGSSLRVHVEQPAEMGATYEFQVRTCVAQWNESATSDECFDAAP